MQLPGASHPLVAGDVQHIPRNQMLDRPPAVAFTICISGGASVYEDGSYHAILEVNTQPMQFFWNQSIGLTDVLHSWVV